MSILRYLLRRTAWLLDRPGSRPLLAAVLPALGRRLDCGVKALRYDGGWVHSFGPFVVVEPRPRLRAPELTEERNRTFYNHIYMPREDDVVVDVGTGLGWEALYWSRKVGPRGRVIAIEANPRIADFMRRSVELSGAENVDVLSCAVAEKCGSVLIEDDLEQHLGNAIGQVQGRSSVEVAAAPLDEICSERGANRIDFLKMNIEGAEQLALAGMASLMDRLKVACISCHDFVHAQTGNEFFRTKDKVERFFRDHGFVLISREHSLPEVRDQVNAYNPRLISRAELG